MNAAASIVTKGDVIAGKYQVEHVLGKGSMGVVVAAMHMKLGRRVAIKLMRSDVPLRTDWVARFGREARAVAKIKSEHVAQVLDVGELPGHTPFIVMEHLEGQDLAALLAKRGPLPMVEAVGYLLEACEALAEAHAAGVVHRDLKPAHLFLATKPGRAAVVKVLDFGIAKDIAAAEAVRLTTSATLIGSPLYMPPEQLRSSRDVDARSDIWSLGVILYELLAGRTPFGGDTLATLAVNVLTKPPPPLDRADVPSTLEAVIGRCLRRDRDERYADVASLATALAPFGPAGARASAESSSRILHGSPRPPSVPPPWDTTLPLTTAPLQLPTPEELAPTAPLPVTPPNGVQALPSTPPPASPADHAPPMLTPSGTPRPSSPLALAATPGLTGRLKRLVMFALVVTTLAVLAGMVVGFVALRRGWVTPQGSEGHFARPSQLQGQPAPRLNEQAAAKTKSAPLAEMPSRVATRSAPPKRW